MKYRIRDHQKRRNQYNNHAEWKIFPLRVFMSVLFVSVLASGGYAQPVAGDKSILMQSYVYAVKDSVELGLDVYKKDSVDGKAKPCVLFVFGGAFMAGHRNDTVYNRYFHFLADHNYVVIPISYRLGLKNVKHLSKFDIGPLRKAIDMAVEDVFDATAWIISNAAILGIDTSKIILSGSSSGAITVLGAEYAKRNNKPLASKLPASFQYAGLISFSGALLSFDGKPKYSIKPAPAMLFHGTADKIVPYGKIRFFNKGFFGSSSIAATFKKNKYPYFIYRADGLGHEMAILPMYEHLPMILDFLDQYVNQAKPQEVDIFFNDPTIKPLMTLTPKELFKKLQEKSEDKTQPAPVSFNK